MPTPDQIRATVAAYAEAMSSNDREGWLELFADDATVEDPVGSEQRSGREAVAEFWDFTRTLAAEIRFEVDGPVRIAGDEAAFAGRAISGPKGSRLCVDLIDAMTFDDQGRIVSLRAYWGGDNMHPVDD